MDNVIPRTVAIADGGTVTFEINQGVHQVMIFPPGTRPGDVDTSGLSPIAGCPGPNYINDADGIVLGANPPCGAGGPSIVQHEFNGPGRYLVICRFNPHFEGADMFGWVIVA